MCVDEGLREERAERPDADLSKGEPKAGVLLADAYPREQDRERAVRWLGWVAYHWGDEPVAWWEIPARIPGRWLARARFAMEVAIVIAALGAATGFTLYVAITFLFLAVIVAGRTGIHLPRSRLRRIPQAGSPRRATPQWPRGLGELVLLAASLIPVVTFFPVLVGQWTGPARGDAAGKYRADRRVTAARFAAWLGSAGLLAAIVLGSGASAGAWIGVDVSLATGAGLLAALTPGPYPMVKLTELILLAQWRRAAGLYRVLSVAAARQVLLPAGDRWEFRDANVRASLAIAHAAELSERDRAREARAARNIRGAQPTGVRARLVAALDARRIARAQADLAAGVALFLLLLGLTLAHEPAHPERWGTVILFSVIAVAAGALCYACVPRLLRRGVAWAWWTVVNVAPFSRRTKLAVAAVAVAAAAALVVTAGSVLAAFAAAVIPSVMVAGCGAWVLLLTRRAARPGARQRGSESGEPGEPGDPGRQESAGRSGSGRASWWLRGLQDSVAAATIGTALLTLARQDVLAAQPSAGLLFPIAAWVSFRAWRAMNDSGRLAVRTAADIAFSLLLGADLVLFVVWLANVLGLSRTEVSALRGALDQAGEAADLPWWLWTGLYAVLAGAAVAFAVWPERLRRAIELTTRLRMVPVADVIRRVLSGVHIGLLVIVLVAVAVPAAVFPVLRNQIATRYTVAYQRQLEAAGEQAAYVAISRQFTTGTANRSVLARIVEKVHDIDHPAHGDGHATPAEADIARRVGELQATILLAADSGPGTATQQGAALAAPVSDAAELRTRVSQLDEEDKKEDASQRRAEQAGDLAAATVASLLSVPDLGSNEVVQIVREYLSGLVEESPLKDVFAAWTERLAHARRPPDAQTLVIPDPLKLETEAAYTQFKEDEKDHFATLLPSTARESPVDAAVDLANQARYLSEGSAGPCAGCTPVESHDEPVHEPIEDHPVP